MPASDGGDLTELLVAWSQGSRGAGDELIRRTYAQLRSIARSRLAAEPGSPTIQPTELVHEAFVRLAGQRRVAWRSRLQFFALAAAAMRRLLVDRARRRGAGKRGGGALRLDLEAIRDRPAAGGVEVLALDRALRRLESWDPFKARIVELKFFAGLSEPEVAVALECSRDTVTRHWRSARAWLARELSGAPP